MLKWIDILRFANNGNPIPDQKIIKTDEEWQNELDDEVFRITRMRGTERPYSSEMCGLFVPGRYACACCNTELFDAEEKFDSNTGWPSFTQPIKENAIAYHKDKGFGMYRIETVCNTCDAHLGHVFQDGPPPSGLRYCMNALALKKVESDIRYATLGGGCFWCTEAIFRYLNGVINVESGYAGGKSAHPTYREVSSGLSGHAEVVEITYDKSILSFYQLVMIHLTTHDPTTLNKQGADHGTQYRSVIYYRNEEERQEALKAIEEVQGQLDEHIVTEVVPFSGFYKAENYHQNYYSENGDAPYCKIVINPKLNKFREKYTTLLKNEDQNLVDN